MYHNGYIETLPVQLPEVQDKIKEYFEFIYNHNYLTENKKRFVMILNRSLYLG